jgi:tetratricopeptide (TPR) repeat protein
LLFQNAVQFDPQNELICYKFAQVLLATGKEDQANQMLAKCLEINPDYEKALVLLGDEALKGGDVQKAADFYERAIQANKKYYGVYPKLAGIYAETNVLRTRKILKDCLNLNSKYKPALEALAETYRKSNPAIARKYDELIMKLK